jgi:hypothetical protein
MAGPDIFPPRVIANDCAWGVFLCATDLPREHASAAAETERDEPSAGSRAMKYVMGFIVGVAVTIGGAAVYDNMGPGANANPLVNWTAVNDLQRSTVSYLKDQIDHLAKQLGLI